jgi:hypothetical protein
MAKTRRVGRLLKATRGLAGLKECDLQSAGRAEFRNYCAWLDWAVSEARVEQTRRRELAWRAEPRLPAARLEPKRARNFRDFTVKGKRA